MGERRVTHHVHGIEHAVRLLGAVACCLVAGHRAGLVLVHRGAHAGAETATVSAHCGGRGHHSARSGGRHTCRKGRVWVGRIRVSVERSFLRECEIAHGNSLFSHDFPLVGARFLTSCGFITTKVIPVSTV